jgi:hypothetical protein
VTEYAVARESRRRSRSLSSLAFVVVASAALAVGSGPWPVLVFLLALAVVWISAYAALTWRSTRAASARVASGAPAAWAAHLPAGAAELSGMTFRREHKASMEMTGHLSLEPPGLVWRPRRNMQRALQIGPVSWGAGEWTVRLTPVWGPADQGHFELIDSQGRIVDLWVYRQRSLAAALRSNGSPMSLDGSQRP